MAEMFLDNKVGKLGVLVFQHQLKLVSPSGGGVTDTVFRLFDGSVFLNTVVWWSRDANGKTDHRRLLWDPRTAIGSGDASVPSV
jgi:hypothetical protein